MVFGSGPAAARARAGADRGEVARARALTVAVVIKPFPVRARWSAGRASTPRDVVDTPIRDSNDAAHMAGRDTTMTEAFGSRRLPNAVQGIST
jgi:cell division GTPase FtsZ